MTPTDSSTASRYSSMNKFTTVADIGPLDKAVAEALEIKRNRYAHSSLGRNYTI